MKALAHRVTLAQLSPAGIGDVVVITHFYALHACYGTGSFADKGYFRIYLSSIITSVIAAESPALHELPSELEQDAKFGA